MPTTTVSHLLPQEGHRAGAARPEILNETLTRLNSSRAVCHLMHAMQRSVNSWSTVACGLITNTMLQAPGISYCRRPALLAGSAQAAPPQNCRQGQGHR